MKALTQITTMQELADAAGVSLATVSRVLNGSDKVSEKTKESVMELVRQSGFFPNETARTMAAGKSRLIAVILPDVENPYFSRLLSEIENQCVGHGYSMIFFNSKGDSEKEKDIVNKMMARQADGMFIAMTKYKSESIPVLTQATFPVVVMSQNIEGLNSVCIDHQEGGALAARHLLENNCESFFFFGRKDDDKFTGFRKELLEKGIAEEKIQTFGDNDWYSTNFDEASGQMDYFMQEKLSDRKTGLFCVNDLFAVRAIRAAHRNNVKIPDMLSLVGFDNTMICDMAYPTLTSISQPLEEIAAESFNLLCRKIQEGKNGEKCPQSIIFHPSLVKRES